MLLDLLFLNIDSSLVVRSSRKIMLKRKILKSRSSISCISSSYCLLIEYNFVYLIQRRLHTKTNHVSVLSIRRHNNLGSKRGREFGSFISPKEVAY